MKKRKTIKILNIIFIAMFVIAAFNLCKIYYEYNKADVVYGEIQDQYVAPILEVTEPQNAPDDEPDIEKVPSAPVAIDFPSLLDRNKDIVGWLYCPDTIVNYPVVQGKNNDQYLRRDLDGKHLRSGTLFADYRNGVLGEDRNYIIYGHNMKNETMFHMLTRYKEQEFYEQHPVMYYLTPEGNYKLELFAGLVVKRDDEIYVPDPGQDSFMDFLNGYKSTSTFRSEAEPQQGDIIVTLSTCSYEFDNARYIVIGRLMPL